MTVTGIPRGRAREAGGKCLNPCLAQSSGLRTGHGEIWGRASYFSGAESVAAAMYFLNDDFDH
jgi:hypothetical protein